MRLDLVAAMLATAQALTGVGFGAADSDLPRPLTDRLADPSITMAMHIQWPAARSSPTVERALELSGEGASLGPLTPLVTSVAEAVDLLPVDADDVTDVWLESDSGTWVYGAGLWARTTLDQEDLRGELVDAGWVDLGDGRLGLPPPPELLSELEAEIEQMAREMEVAEEELADYRTSLAAPTTVVALVGEGWLALSPNWARGGSTGEELGDQTASLDDLAFPVAGLVDLADSTLLAAAFNLPNNDRGPDVDVRVLEPPEDSIEAVHRRISELERREDPFAGGLADILVTVQELDGAIAVDVVARRPGGGGVNESADFLDMLVLAARVAASPDQGLSRELGHVTVTRAADEVRAEGVFSQATLIGTLEDRYARSAELGQLYRRLYELQQAELEETVSP